MKKLSFYLFVVALLMPGMVSALSLQDLGFPTQSIPQATTVSQTRNGVTVSLSSTWVARVAALGAFNEPNPPGNLKPGLSVTVTSNNADNYLQSISVYLDGVVNNRRLSYLPPGTQRFVNTHLGDSLENDFRIVERFTTRKPKTYEGYHYWNEYMTAQEITNTGYNGIWVFVMTAGGYDLFRFSDWDVLRPSLAALNALPAESYPITTRPAQPTAFPDEGFADGFENGLGGWDTVGYAAVQRNYRSPGPRAPERQQHALLVADGRDYVSTRFATGGTNPNAFATRGQLVDFIGTRHADMHIPGTLAKRGSAIRVQNIEARVGTRVTARVRFMTGDWRNPDYGFFFAKEDGEMAEITPIAINGQSGNGLLAIRNMAWVVYPTGVLLHRGTGYREFTHTFTEAGTFTIGFGVVNSGVNDGPSALLVDEVEVLHPGQ